MATSFYYESPPDLDIWTYPGEGGDGLRSRMKPTMSDTTETPSSEESVRFNHDSDQDTVKSAGEMAKEKLKNETSQERIVLAPRPKRFEGSYSFLKDSTLHKNWTYCARVYDDLETGRDTLSLSNDIKMVDPDLYSGKTYPYFNEYTDSEPPEQSVLWLAGKFMYEEKILPRETKEKKEKKEREERERVELEKTERAAKLKARTDAIELPVLAKLARTERDKWSTLIPVERELVKARDRRRENDRLNPNRREIGHLDPFLMEERRLMAKASMMQEEYKSDAAQERADMRKAVEQERLNFEKEMKIEDEKKQLERQRAEEKSRLKEQKKLVRANSKATNSKSQEKSKKYKEPPQSALQEEVNPVGETPEIVLEPEEECHAEYIRRRLLDPQSEEDKQGSEFLDWAVILRKALEEMKAEEAVLKIEGPETIGQNPKEFDMERELERLEKRLKEKMEKGIEARLKVDDFFEDYVGPNFIL